MKLKLNPAYAKRHLFVTVLMSGLTLWFGYDGFIRYPSIPAADLYRSIEGSDAPASVDLEAFKRQKTHTQYGFTLFALVMALVVGVRLNNSRRFSFEYDDDGFTAEGVRYAYKDIAEVDRSRWEKKSIMSLKLSDGRRVVLDGWHHLGVAEFVGRLDGR